VGKSHGGYRPQTRKLKSKGSNEGILGWGDGEITEGKNGDPSRERRPGKNTCKGQMNLYPKEPI